MDPVPSLPRRQDETMTAEPSNMTIYGSFALEGDASVTSVASPFASPTTNGAETKASPSSIPEAQGHPKWQKMRRYIRPQMDTHLDLSFVILAIVVYGSLFFSMGTAFLPGHPTWCTLLLWASSLIGAFIAHQIFLPRVIGMLVAGVLLQNIPWSAIDAFPPRWGTQMRAGALATIFLRCGLELDFGTMRKFKYPAIKLALIPGLAEAFFDAGLGVALFGMDYTLGLCMGFILKAVGPGLVVPAMFRLQKAGRGTDKGIPATVVISASFDDVIAITGYAIFSTIAIQGDGSSDQAWTIASGPVQVIFGILGGIIAGFAIGATKIWNTRLKRFVALFFSGMLIMFFLEYYQLLSGGALGALFTGLVASNLWEKGMPRRLSLGPSYQFSPECERSLSAIWSWIMEPILFVTVGSTLDFSQISAGTIPKSVAIVCSGVALRMLCTCAAMYGKTYTWKEQVFYAVAWTPKATVQAALSAAPLTLIKELKVNDPDYEQWLQWGNDILTTGLFAILICGTLGVLAIHFTAPVLLQPTKKRPEQLEGKDSSRIEGEEGTGQAPEGPRIERRPSSAQGERDLTRAGTGGSAIYTDRSEGGSVIPLKRAASADYGRGTGRPGSPAWPLSTLVAGDDLALVAEYIDAVNALTVALKAGEPLYSKAELFRLSDKVTRLRDKIELEVGRYEPSVRELFRTASVIGTRRTMRQKRGADSSKSMGDLPKHADDAV